MANSIRDFVRFTRFTLPVFLPIFLADFLHDFLPTV